MKIAIDAMGGDHAPRAIVEATMQVIKEKPDLEIILVGNSEQIRDYLTFDSNVR